MTLPENAMGDCGEEGLPGGRGGAPVLQEGTCFRLSVNDGIPYN